MSPLLLITTCPDQASAEHLAEILVQTRHAACVSVVPGLTSFYHWQGAVRRDAEWLLLIKSSDSAYPQLEQVLLAHHPYELPELVAVPIARGLPGYLDWLAQQVEAHG